MNDSDVRKIVLHVFYETRAENFILINEKNFGDHFPISEVYQICSQLKDSGYIHFEPVYANNKIYHAWGKISVSGIDYVEQMRSEREKSDSVSNVFIQDERSQLRDFIENHFNDSELRDLCFDLKVDYENLDQGGKSDKIRGLITYFERRDLSDQLTQAIENVRPSFKLKPNKVFSGV